MDLRDRLVRLDPWDRPAHEARPVPLEARVLKAQRENAARLEFKEFQASPDHREQQALVQRERRDRPEASDLRDQRALVVQPERTARLVHRVSRGLPELRVRSADLPAPRDRLAPRDLKDLPVSRDLTVLQDRLALKAPKDRLALKEISDRLVLPGLQVPLVLAV